MPHTVRAQHFSLLTSSFQTAYRILTAPQLQQSEAHPSQEDLQRGLEHPLQFYFLRMFNAISALLHSGGLHIFC